MANPSQTLAAGVQASTAGASAVGPNQRAKSSAGALGTAPEQVLFSPPSVVGVWVVPDTRTRAAGMPTISSASIGQATQVNGSVVPMSVTQGDSRVRSS
jgi:hypothetical protein